MINYEQTFNQEQAVAPNMYNVGKILKFYGLNHGFSM